MSKKLKETMLIGSAILMFASVGTGVSNVNANASKYHYRTINEIGYYGVAKEGPHIQSNGAKFHRRHAKRSYKRHSHARVRRTRKSKKRETPRMSYYKVKYYTLKRVLNAINKIGDGYNDFTDTLSFNNDDKTANSILNNRAKSSYKNFGKYVKDVSKELRSYIHANDDNSNSNNSDRVVTIKTYEAFAPLFSKVQNKQLRPKINYLSRYKFRKHSPKSYAKFIADVINILGNDIERL